MILVDSDGYPFIIHTTMIKIATVGFIDMEDEMRDKGHKNKVKIYWKPIRFGIFMSITLTFLWALIFRAVSNSSILLSTTFGLLTVVFSFLFTLWISKLIHTSRIDMMAIIVGVFSLPSVWVAYGVYLLICWVNTGCWFKGALNVFWKITAIGGIASFLGSIGLGSNFMRIYDELKKKSANVEAQLRTLKDIINPHYLFNIFSSIQAYMWLDKNKADRMIVLLADAFRYVLKSERKGYVPLSEELDYVESLAQLNSMQGGNEDKEIVITRNGDEDYLVPPFGIFVFERFMLKFDKFTSIFSSRPVLFEGRRAGNYYFLRYRFSDSAADDWMDMARFIVEIGKNFWAGLEIKYEIDKKARELRLWLPLRRSKS